MKQTTAEALNNKFYLVPNSSDSDYSCFYLEQASLFKIIDVKELTDRTAYMFLIRHISGPCDEIFNKIGEVEEGSWYVCSYHIASNIATLGKEKLEDLTVIKRLTEEK